MHPFNATSAASHNHVLIALGVAVGEKGSSQNSCPANPTVAGAVGSTLLNEFDAGDVQQVVHPELYVVLSVPLPLGLDVYHGKGFGFSKNSSYFFIDEIPRMNSVMLAIGIEGQVI